MANDFSFKFYESVIEDVISSIKNDDCLDEGPEDEILKMLKQTWLEKLFQTKAVNMPAHYLEKKTVPRISSSQSHYYQPQPPQPMVPRYMMPSGSMVMPGFQPQYGGVMREGTNFLPPNHNMFNMMKRDPSQSASSMPLVQQFYERSPQWMQQPNVHYQQPMLGSNLPYQQGPSTSYMPQPNNASFDQKQWELCNKFQQHDGRKTDSSDDEEKSNSSDELLEDENSLKDSADEDDNDDEEESLNGNDDLSDDDPEDAFDINNMVVCQYEKIIRSKNHWKIILKDGIMNLEGKDFVFSKAAGEADW